MLARVRIIHALALALALALVASLAGCGGDDSSPEACGTPGDEDGDGQADCADSDCAAFPACQPRCGDGHQDTGEQCDDGNQVDTDACTNACEDARCGDAIIGPGEQCDDANQVNTDACTNACMNARCGDTFVGPGEQCDDGNQSNTDDCTNACMNARCGDGFLQGSEVCDDGNNVDTDACTNACMNARCGDGITGPGEQCDDGNMANTDACTNACLNAACGDGFVGPGEACDDGNMVNNDGCSNMCALPGCGDGIVQANEQCDDGNQVNTDACLNSCMNATCGDMFTRAGVEECDDGNQVDTDACRNSCMNARCGDMVVRTGVEQCDDGNMVNNDACSNACMLARCGDTILQAGEACDDGNMTNGDGCDNNCTMSRCGNGVVGGTEQCDDANLVNGDGCDNNCTTTACGNGIRTGTEQCDDGNVVNGDGCSATCVAECGNGTLDPGEQCDDGNRTGLDGCSGTCRLESNEVEPNEDGTPSTGGFGIAGNDFDVGGNLAVMNATNQGVINASGGSTARLATIDPAGDEDVFAIRNDGPTPVEVRLDVWSRAATFGENVPCGTTIDTGLQVRDAAGTVLYSNDDRNGAADQCSGLSLLLAVNTTIYAQITEYGDDTAINTPGYGFQVRFIPVVCGDGHVTTTLEECDDGNTANGDGCTATCIVEGTSETEPNEDGTPSTGGTGIGGNDFDVGGNLAVMNATNQGVHNITTGSRNWLGTITPAGDEDVFAITNPGPSSYEVTVDSWDRNVGVGIPCSDTDTGLNLRDAAGVVLTSNDDSTGHGACSHIVFTMLPNQTRYLHLVEYGDNAIIARYVLQVVGRVLVCGDGVQTSLVEECDDGNAVNGDGCSSTCTVEGVAETEPNDDGVPATGATGITGNDFDAAGGIAVMNANAQGIVNLAAGGRTWRAAINPLGDEDVFAVTNGGALPIQVTANTYDLNVGINRACPSSSDTGINVKDAAGVVQPAGTLTDNRVSGTDYCSRAVFGVLPGQTRYIQVVRSGDNTLLAKYALVVGSVPVVCGDGAIGFGEECDDSNAMNGDGCSSTCQLEAAVNEVEPNGTTAEADASALQINGSRLIRASIGPAGTDLDRYRVTVAAPTVIRFETFAPLPGDCDGTTTTVRLLNAAGTEITNDNAGATNASGIAGCGALVIPVDAGTYYVQVEETGTNATVAKYFLDVAFQTDKGAESEAAATLGVNDTSATASANLLASNNTYVFGDHTLNADADYYSITVPAGARIRAEVVEGDRATETCESNGVDSVLELRDQTGAVVLVSDDDDGRGFCSAIDGTGTTPRDAAARNATAAAQTYYLNVRQSGTGTGVAGQFKYGLQVTIR